MSSRSFALALVLAGGCGYQFANHGQPLPPGAESVFVAPFENRTGDAEAGALVAAAVRDELARRGREGGAGAPARVEGEVTESGFGPSGPGGQTYRLTMEIRARLK